MRILHNIIASILIGLMKKRGEYRFKKWILLEGIKEKIADAVENRRENFPNLLIEYISTASGGKWFEQADWIKVIELFYVCLSRSPKVKLPILSPTDEKSKDDPWTYEGRDWHLYAHLIAKTYGWSLEEISQLSVREALAIIQEIMVDEQLNREFYYGLSEIAYPYDRATQKSIYKPLPRPHWMRPIVNPQSIPRFKIPKSMLPEGVVYMDKVLPDEYLPKEIH